MRKTIEIEDTETARALLGEGDCHLRRVREALGVEVVVRRDNLHLAGADTSVDKGVRTFERMLQIVREGRPLEANDVERILSVVQGNEDILSGSRPRKGQARTWGSQERDRNRERERQDDLLAGRVRPSSPGQGRYIEAIRKYDVVFAIGPAGSGKTYLAVAMAIECLASRLVNRLVLVRPAVEAGEHLGFLPGDLREKVNPYLRPLYDALEDIMPADWVRRAIESRTIEIAPLAYMRGRTLADAFVILDEAQNATTAQMKMFLTRLGLNSRVVITGDKTQIDLPRRDDSGLLQIENILPGIDGIGFVYLNEVDVVRHKLVKDIIKAYATADESRQEN